MNDRKQALEALRDKVKAGDRAGFRKANRAVFSTPCQDMELQMREVSCRHAFHGSIDGAKALHDAVLPGWGMTIYGGFFSGGNFGAVVSISPEGKPRKQYGGDNENPARAWLLAILEALISETPKGETP